MSGISKGKKLPIRTPSQVLEDESRLALRNTLPLEWIIRDFTEDYGADMSVEIFESSLPTGFEFLIQLKARSNTKPLGSFSVNVPTSTINYLRQRSLPSMIVGYQPPNKLYYRWLDEFLAARAYTQSKSNAKTYSIIFPQNSLMTRESRKDILDYFRPAGISEKRVNMLLKKMPKAGAQQRYDILRELRFTKSPEGILYLLSILPLDAILSNLDLVDVSSNTFDSLVRMCLVRPTLAMLMMFWGVAAHLAKQETNTFTPIAARLFKLMLPEIQCFDPGIVATLSLNLFGYSTETGIDRMIKKIDNKVFMNTSQTICKKLKPLRAESASRAVAADMYASLYTIQLIGDRFVYLTDIEMQAINQFYNEGRDEMLKYKNNAEEMAIHGRGYFNVLKNVFGYQYDLEDEKSDADVKRLLSSMATMKVDIFMECLTQKEYTDNATGKLSEKNMIIMIARDMFEFTKMLWFSEALDWFGQSCFCRRFFRGEG